MLKIQKWLAIILTMSLLINLIPMDVLAVVSEKEEIVVETPVETEKSTASLSQLSNEVPQESEESLELSPKPTMEDAQEPEESHEPTTEETRESETAALFTNDFATRFASVLTDNNHSANLIIEGNNTITLKVEDGGVLALLSKEDASNYKDWILDFGATGQLILPDDFQGLGSDAAPFEGEFIGSVASIKTKHALFNCLSSIAKLKDFPIKWAGAQDKAILAEKLVLYSDYTIPMSLIFDNNDKGAFSPFIGTVHNSVDSAVKVELPNLDYTYADPQLKTDTTTDIGLLCRQLGKKVQLHVSNLMLPKNTRFQFSGNVNTGGLVGFMDAGSKLIISQQLTLNTLLIGGNSAGGLVGKMATGATIEFEANAGVDISAELKAANTGGIAGVVETENGPIHYPYTAENMVLATEFTVNAIPENVCIRSVKANGTENAGILYGSCTVTGTFNPFDGVTFADDVVREVSGSKNCGGVFGTLTINDNGKCSISRTETPIVSTLQLSNTIAGSSATGKNTQYGGIAGTLNGATRKNALVMKHCDITSIVDVGNNTENYPKYLGGIVAKQQTVTLDTGSCTIFVNNPTTINANNYGFGGLCAYLDKKALLVADGMKVVTDSFTLNPGGGGVVGSSYEGSIVYLKTSLDLSECLLTTNDTSGQIVGKQESSLIYAPDVEIMRLRTGSYNGMELDDIGNYGELYRLSGFLTCSEDYTITLPQLKKTGDSYTITDQTDYACFALALQSRGNFDTVEGITAGNWGDLRSSIITLGAAIDLTGKGIGGLTRDVYSTLDVFTGTFKGNNYTIILDIGAENQGGSDRVAIGDGRIYRHNATGLFAVMSASASVENLKLAGSIRLSNSQKKVTNNFNVNAMKSGALAALVTGAQTCISNVSTAVAFDVVCDGANPLYLGGLVGIIGYISGTSSPALTFTNNTSLAATITLTHKNNGYFNHIGGFIGGIDGKSGVTINCTGGNISGSIESKGTVYNLYAGGLIGTIMPSDNSTRNINLEKLSVTGFSFSGNAKERMGGILGGIWADTDVTIGNLTVNGTTLTSSGAAELGGLVYRAGGKWNVEKVDLGGLNINAVSSTKALGLMVCHGDPYKEMINSTNAPTNMNALYLEMTTPWDTGYLVPTVNNFGSGVFDEFVAYTAYANRIDDTANYDITHNGSGIISLKTGNGEVNMIDRSRNTYVNRVKGVNVSTNKFSRYYYNLDSIMDGPNDLDDKINTAQELLIWSVCRYADSTLRKHFTVHGIDNLREVYTIGDTSEIVFDFSGLSYYPIDIINESITVRNVTVQFYNDEIEKIEDGNKLTRGSDNDHSQHYMMHCGLFHDFEAENLEQLEEDKIKNRTMTVNGVSFAGSVGVVNGGSGALLCGQVSGQTISGKTSVCKVILADADNESKAITLKGISVKGAADSDYAPVLINKFKSYSALEANYVKIDGEVQTGIAGSSLVGDIGDVENGNATNVKISFAGTIKLPETEKSVFTKATLINRLRYENGSAVYNFTQGKDYPEPGSEYKHNATHGRELGPGISVEYAGKQGKYQTSELFVSKNGNFSEHNDFSGDLPYVAYSPATDSDSYSLINNWHELAVNVPSTNLTDGCGTYGHPYQVTVDTFLAAANFINNGVAVDNWEICIPADNTAYDSENDKKDITLIYKDGGWKDKTDNTSYTMEKVRKHLQSAYYQLMVTDGKFELKNFNGIGADKEWAFKGVITGKQSDGTSAMVSFTEGSSAFIKYSYGCVVRDVDFELNQTLTLTRGTWSRGTPEQTPGIFFGGVIGCVLGGDNIIENVKVSTGSGFKATLSGNNPHLIPMGGYIGVIAGGGVIFRGAYAETTGITGTDAQLYRNPYIGRVLGGYAFYETDDSNTKAPNNSDKNYTINKITPPAQGKEDLSWDGSTLTVNNEQGLLILSAIVSSGAGNINSLAYTKGVARNAKYNEIGSVTEPSDYTSANKDAEAAWSGTTTYNTPYLLKRYAGYTGNASICTGTNSGIDIKFQQNADFDMSGYNNGYRALSARYVSNAAFNGTSVDASMVVLRVRTFDGQGATVKNINMAVKEYNNDDFHAASLGGIFNIVWTQKQSGGGKDGSNFAQNLTLKDCMVSLQYINSSGNNVNIANTTTLADADGLRCVSVGGFIGMANDIEASKGLVNHNYLFTEIRIEATEGKKCKITGPNSAGGLIGATAMGNTGINGYPGILLANGKWALFGPSFLNCSYKDIEVTGNLAAGGLIGDAYAGTSPTVNFSGLGIPYETGAFRCYASCTVTQEHLIVGQDSTITARAKGSIAAGIFGAAGMRVGVNDPEVGTENKTNLTISGKMYPLKLSNVNVFVSKENFNVSGSYPDSGENNAYAGGIIARIGNVNPVCFYDIDIEGGSVSSILATNSFVGGIVGSGYTNTTNMMQNCHLSGLNVTGVYAGGFLGRGYTATGFTLYMSDCSITGSKIYGTSSTTASPTTDAYAGGLLGSAASNYYLYNLLIKNTSIRSDKPDRAGRLFGYMDINDASNDFKVYAAGISVFSDDPDINVPEKEGYCAANKNYTGYIAYADYAGTDSSVPEKPDEKSPYVTVNPNFTLSGVSKLMTGDAVGIDSKEDQSGKTIVTSIASRIWADQKLSNPSLRLNRASYQNVTTIANSNDVPEISTFQMFQKYGNEEEKWTDFPVLVLKGGDASPIENYLNVITNGGYATAKEKAGSYVTVENPKVYYYDKDTSIFTEATSTQLNAEPASIIKTASNTFEVKTGSYDNTRDRFTLLEFKFKTTVNGPAKYYTVSIPVVVERELQCDFMATFTPGTVFNKDFYTELTDHILESAGTPMTAYLSYRYNRRLNQYVEYDWQSYLDSEEGFRMLIGDPRTEGMDKILTFYGSLPPGTQLILVDCQNGNQAYRYEVTSQERDVRLSQFTSVCENDKHFKASIGVVLGISAEEDSNGKYVRTGSSENAILLRDGYYYALAGDTDTGTRYHLTAPDLKNNTAEENYYLVITVPESDDPMFKLNGNLTSALKWSVPTSVTQVHRKYPDSADTQSQTESTYQISSGYQQSLLTRPEEGKTVNIDSTDQVLKIDLVDTISFNKDQLYTDNDKLFLKFTASLMSYTVDKTDENKTTSSLKQFRNGITGTVKFFVQDENGTYYIPTESGWAVALGIPAASYDWMSNGANIELPLSKDGTTALDLSGVRTAVIGTDDTVIGKILVTVQMDVVFGSQDILEDTIPASVNGMDAYAKLHYVSRISTQEKSLNYSTVRETATDKVQYYRAVQENVTLSMDAITIDQLGINPLELVEEYQEMMNGKNASRIDIIAELEMVTQEKAQMFLEKTQTLRFRLSLYRRNGERNGKKYFEPVSESEAANLLVVKWSEHEDNGSTGWTWDIPREKFTGDGVDENFFNGTAFTIPLTAYVFTEPTDFANYKLEIEVSFLDALGNEVADLPTIDEKDAYVVYTYACIKPTFFEP